jgi:hypothetical protein
MSSNSPRALDFMDRVPSNMALSSKAERFRGSVTPSSASRGRQYYGRKASVLSCFPVVSRDERPNTRSGLIE